MKQVKCKYCKGTGKTLIADETNSEMKFMGIIMGGRDINKPCKKCNGTGWKLK